MFGANEDFKVNELPILAPGIYQRFRLAKWSIGPVKKQDGSEGKKVITFTFKGKYTKGASEYVGEYQHTEWETDDAKKATNLVKRVSHILDALGVPEEKILSNKTTTFDDYMAWVNDILIDHKPNLPKALVDIKIVGNVYNGKKTSGFTPYLGFICTSGTKELRFSSQEETANLQYSTFVVKSKPDVEFAEEEDAVTFEE